MASFENSYCGQLVREQDPDRFLLSHFAPVEAREALWALFAFNHEIAKTREVVSETQLGLIRLQWWREAIAEIYEGGAVREHVVVQALTEAIRAHGLPREGFDALIYAREFDLEDVLPSDLEGFLNYADYTSTPLMKLAVIITGGDAEVDPVRVVAMNYALVGILRATVSFAKQRRCYLPQAAMAHNSVSVNQLFELKKQDGLREVVEAVAEEFVDGVVCENRYLRVSQRLSKIYFKQLKKLGYDVFHPRLILPPAFKELRIVLGL